MSSGSSSFSSLKSHPIIETNRKSDLKSEIKAHELEIKKDIERSVTDSICYHSCLLAEQVSAKAIITMTHSGYSALKISSSRPSCMVYAFTTK